jgi:hypothetical protein
VITGSLLASTPVPVSHDIVVLGSYAPLPGPATAASVSAQRRAWDQGASVTVASYRTGAAPHIVPAVGPLAGWRVEQLRRHLGGRHLMVGFQPGAPFVHADDPRLRTAQYLATAVGLFAAFRRWEEVTVLATGDPDIPRRFIDVVGRSVKRFVVANESDRQLWLERYGVEAEVVEVDPYPYRPGPVLYDPASYQRVEPVEEPFLPLTHRIRYRGQLARQAVYRRVRARLARP